VYLREDAVSGLSYLENQSEVRAATADVAARLLDAAIAARTVPGQRRLLLHAIKLLVWFLARDAFVRTNCRAIVVMLVRLCVCLSGTGVHCDHTVFYRAQLSLDWIVRCSGYPDTKACPATASRLFPVPDQAKN